MEERRLLFLLVKKNHRKDCLSFSSYSISCPSSLPLWSLLVLTDLPCYSANSASAFFLNFLRSSLILLHVAVEGGSGTMMASPGIVPESGRKLPIKKVNLKIPPTSHSELCLDIKAVFMWKVKFELTLLIQSDPVHTMSQIKKKDKYSFLLKL